MKMNKRILALLGTGHAMTDISQGALPMMLAFLQPVFALSQLQVGMVMLAFNLSSSVIQPVFGILSDRFRAAWLIPLGCLLAGVGMALTGFSTNFPVLLAVSLASGLGVAAYHPEGSKYARLASGKRKATGMSIFSVGGNLGFAAGPVLATFFFALAGLRGSVGFLVLNGIMAGLLWLTLARITAAPGGTGVTSAGQIKPNAGPISPPARDIKSAGKGIPWYVLPVALLITVVVMRSFVHFGLVTFLPQYYVHYLQHSEQYAAAITSVFLFAGVFGTLVGGPAADRWGLKNIIVASMVALVPLLYLFVHLEGIWTTVIVALMGFAIISTFAVTVVLGQEMMPGNVGLASGLMLGFGIGMGGVGATLLGWVADRWGLPAVFETMIIFPVIGLVLALLLPGRKELAEKQQA
ncbi:MFS transporter [Desulfallas thermosapovorans]|uniref:FSR family fosmidomycin resistance protein-like MFS transporter n=1 Tax=Desulfallas thermosapovorans DSM 6562 TaxID=1121431 RepID=A0A5S4ZSQ1_9FIRM|nr:MFS transporter [Desulfallas thermosapovorans]TYO95976.1 FSR family fosmidomycin resistance protein-like MFS transporter [Desulfallas thermosapovorans DSM 6562]